MTSFGCFSIMRKIYDDNLIGFPDVSFDGQGHTCYPQSDMDDKIWNYELRFTVYMSNVHTMYVLTLHFDGKERKNDEKRSTIWYKVRVNSEFTRQRLIITNYSPKQTLIQR